MAVDSPGTIVGVLSDSHGNVDATRRAVAALLERGASMLVHLGDFESEAILDELAGHDAHVVFGNCDYDTNSLTRYADHLDIAVHHPAGRIDVCGRAIAFTHGHFNRLMQAAIDDNVDYLLHGHSHEVRDETIGSTRVINPGALFRAPRYTVALLEPAADVVTWIEIDKVPAGSARGRSDRGGQI